MKLNQILQEGIAGRAKRTRFKWPGKRWIVVDEQTGKFASSKSSGFTDNPENVYFWYDEDRAKKYADGENDTNARRNYWLKKQREESEQETQIPFEDWLNNLRESMERELTRYKRKEVPTYTHLHDQLKQFGPPSTWGDPKKNRALKKGYTRFKANARRRLKKKTPTDNERYVVRPLAVTYEY